MIEELNDPQRHYMRMSDIHQGGIVFRIRSWLIKKLAGDYMVICNTRVFGRVENEKAIDIVLHDNYFGLPDFVEGQHYPYVTVIRRDV